MRAPIRGLLARLREWWAIDAPPEERIEGSGEVHLDPAYNGRYTAERRLRQLSRAQEGARTDNGRDPVGPDG